MSGVEVGWGWGRGEVLDLGFGAKRVIRDHEELALAQLHSNLISYSSRNSLQVVTGTGLITNYDSAGSCFQGACLRRRFG
jgi:hypothetical protein